MALGTYAELQASIASWLNRDDLDAYIPDFIALTEADIERDLRVRAMLVRAITVPEADEPRENLPGDFLQLKAIQFNSNPPRVPDYCTPAFMRVRRGVTGAMTGTPSFYTIEAGELLFDVTPADVELEILYYQKIPRLTDSNTTNWLLTAYPDIYLYGALIHSAPFLKDDERIAVWDGMFQRAKTALKQQDSRGEANAAPVAIRSRRGSV